VKRLLIVTVVASLFAMTPVARAHDAYDDSEANPLRLVAYALYPVGFLAEWLVTRPIHFFVSQPQMEPIFGHVPHENPYGNYGPYDNDDMN
jgi:hypothetical protein